MNSRSDCENLKKHKMLEYIQSISTGANIYFAWQQEMLGLPDAISYAKSYVGDEPFALLLGDNVMTTHDRVPLTQKLIDTYEEYEASTVALWEVDPVARSRYGVFEGEDLGSSVHRAHQLIEKPSLGVTESNLIMPGRYIFTSEIFDAIEKTPVATNGEVQLPDVLSRMMSQGHEIY